MPRRLPVPRFAAAPVLFAAFAMIAALVATATAQVHRDTPAAPTLDAAAWRADLATLFDRIQTVHPDPFKMTSRARFDSAVGAIDTRIPELDAAGVALEFMKLTALIQDGHSGAVGTLPAYGFTQYFPVRLAIDDQGLYVLAAPAAQKDIVGAQVERIGDLKADEALQRVLTICSGDNDFSRMDRAPFYLMMPAVLRELGINDSNDRLTIEVLAPPAAGRKSRSVRATFDAVPATGHPGWYFGGEGLPVEPCVTIHDGASRPAPLHMQRPERAWWFEYLPEHKLVYFEFRRVDPEDQGATFHAFVDHLFAFADSARAEYMVIDIRHNGGGNNDILQPLIHGLIRRNETIARPGHLFTIIGRETFSAAMNCADWIEEHADAVFVGEPTGARPNHFGDATTVTLPKSGMPVRISQWRWSARYPWDDRRYIAPSIAAPPTREAARTNVDPALAAILQVVESGPLTTQLREAMARGGKARAREVIDRWRAIHPDRWGRTTLTDIVDVAEDLFRSGDRERALELGRLGTEVYPREAGAWTALGQGLLLTGDNAGAATAAEKALTIDPASDRARGLLRRAKGEGH
jgi:hypothetical protein